MELLHHIRGIALTTPWAFALLIQDFLLTLLIPLKFIFPSVAYRLASAIAWSCWAGIQLIFERFNGADIVISGDPLPPGESAVVVTNHVAWADFYMVQALAARCRMLGACRWFAKAQLKHVPLLGWGLWVMGMPLVTRKWQQDSRELERVFHSIKSLRLPIWLISFSEGTRYTLQKKVESTKWCAANNKPMPQHLLYPRTKGFVATIRAIRAAPHVRAVYDVTIAYENRRPAKKDRSGYGWLMAPPFWDTLCRPRLRERYRFEVHVRRFAMEDLPSDDAALALWLETRWLEKGDWLEAKRMEWEWEARKESI